MEDEATTEAIRVAYFDLIDRVSDAEDCIRRGRIRAGMCQVCGCKRSGKRDTPICKKCTRRGRAIDQFVW